MNLLRSKTVPFYLSILLPSLLGAAAGGRWLGMVLTVIAAGMAEALDYAALLVSGTLLVGTAGVVYYYVGRVALLLFALTAALAALFGPAFLWEPPPHLPQLSTDSFLWVGGYLASSLIILRSLRWSATSL